MVVGAPEVWTAAGTEVGFVTFWLMDPLPVEVTPEVDIKRAQAAALIRTTKSHKHTQTRKMQFSCCSALQSYSPSWVMGKLQQVASEEPGITT